VRDAVALFCDGSEAIGFGHVNRCLVLARELERRGAGVVFVMRRSSERVLAIVRDEGFEIADSASPPPYAPEPEWAVVDSYAMGAAELAALHRPARRIALIDDIGGRDLTDVDVLINPNLGSYDYIAAAGVRFLRGPKFCLLREEFRRGRRTEHPPRPRRLLLTFGASDPDDVSSRVLEIVRQVDELEEIRVLLGSGYRCMEEIAAASARDPRVVILQDPDDVAGVMLASDLAITAGGSTCYELAALGVPFVTLVCADNQRRSVEGLELEGVARSAGEAAQLDPDRLRGVIRELLPRAARVQQAERGLRLIDGRGVERVAEALSLYERREVEVHPLSRPIRAGVLQRLVEIDGHWLDRLGGRYSSVAWGEREFLLDLPGKWDLSCYATEGERVVGFWIASSAKGPCHTHRVAIAPDCTGGGVGRKMFESVRLRWRRISSGPMTLEVGCENTAAIEFYRQVGFEIRGPDFIRSYLAARGRSATILEDSLREDDGSTFHVMELTG
jgi:UDP-2,4-diacetamido-2,4,6-trideoxy-beta-L-altropyranose hydrolase